MGKSLFFARFSKYRKNIGEIYVFLTFFKYFNLKISKWNKWILLVIQLKRNFKVPFLAFFYFSRKRRRFLKKWESKFLEIRKNKNSWWDIFLQNKNLAFLKCIKIYEITKFGWCVFRIETYQFLENENQRIKWS